MIAWECIVVSSSTSPGREGLHIFFKGESIGEEPKSIEDKNKQTWFYRHFLIHVNTSDPLSFPGLMEN